MIIGHVSRASQVRTAYCYRTIPTVIDHRPTELRDYSNSDIGGGGG